MPIVAMKCPKCLRTVEQDSAYPGLFLNPDRDKVKHPKALHICPGKPDAPKAPTKTVRLDPPQWTTIQAVRSPAGAAAKGSFGYWFNYFWEEAVTIPSPTATDKKVLAETMLACFDQVGSGWQLKDMSQWDSYAKLRLLRNLLHIGFERVPYQPDDVANRGLNPNKAVSATTLFIEAVQDESHKNMKIGYRGDSRTYDQLQAGDGGFRTRARQEGVRRDFGLDQPWHPYSLPIYRDAIFLRKGRNKDNCLHTAISVGVELVQLVHFPILTDETLYRLPPGPIESWKGNEASTLQANYSIRVSNDLLGKYLEHDTQMYVVKITDDVLGFDTEGWQRKGGKDPFPERSVNAIPLENVLGVIVMTRRYWWRTDFGDPREHKWQLFDVENRELRLLPDATTFASRFSQTTADNLLKHLQQQCSAARDRNDIRGDREKRSNFLRNPTATKVNVGAAKDSTFRNVCDQCRAEFPSAVKLGMHQRATGHKQKGAE